MLVGVTPTSLALPAVALEESAAGAGAGVLSADPPRAQPARTAQIAAALARRTTRCLTLVTPSLYLRPCSARPVRRRLCARAPPPSAKRHPAPRRARRLPGPC